ncbi:MAG: RNA polymerase sigma factor [Myxococcaceae bacterium]
MKWNRTDIEALYKRTRIALHSRCLTLLGNDAEAKDLSQEVYLALLQQPGAFKGGDPIAYMFGIASKRALSRLRARYRREMPGLLRSPPSWRPRSPLAILECAPKRRTR